MKNRNCWLNKSLTTSKPRAIWIQDCNAYYTFREVEMDDQECWQRGAKQVDAESDDPVESSSGHSPTTMDVIPRTVNWLLSSNI